MHEGGIDRYFSVQRRGLTTPDPVHCIQYTDRMFSTGLAVFQIGQQREAEGKPDKRLILSKSDCDITVP